MLIVDEANAVEYLRDLGWIDRHERASVRTLAGGVSNCVLYVSRPDRPGIDFVFKQAREQLRTPDPWFCGVERIWREVAVLQWCERLLAGSPAVACRVSTPRILHEDRANYAFAMSAAPANHRVWRTELLAGHFDPRIAAACGNVLGSLHAASWERADVARDLDDRQIFDELRLDPYYRFTARSQPDVAADLERLIASVWRRRRCLVHADFSPKNLLTYEGGLMLVDFETGHYGDPAFDLGFYLAHSMLKAFFHAPKHESLFELTRQFWSAYEHIVAPRVGAHEYASLVQHGILNLAGCAAARVDGKSKVDYLSETRHRPAVRAWFRDLFSEAPTAWVRVLELARVRIEASLSSSPV